MKSFLLTFLVTCQGLAQTICNDPDIQRNFRITDPKKFHYYVTETKVCNTIEDWKCTQTNVFNKFISNVSFAAPTSQQTPVSDCGIYNVRYPNLLGLGGPIRISIDSKGFSITNYTKTGHSFHPGKVVRKIIQRGSTIYIKSEGSGIGNYKELNDSDELMQIFWGEIDKRLVNSFKKPPIIDQTEPSVKLDESEEFNKFIQQFSNDPVFQRNHIKFPLIWNEYPDDKTITHKETQAKWKHYNILKPSSEDYEVSIIFPIADKPNEASVGETCRAGNCGYGAGLKFKRINGIWFCVSRYFISN